MTFPRLKIMLLLLTLCSASFAQAGTLIFGPRVEVDGELKLLNSPLCFSDGSCMNTAVFSDGSAVWGQITGYIDDQLDLSVKFATKEDKAAKNTANGYAGLDDTSRINHSQLPLFGHNSVSIVVAGTTPEWQINILDWTTIDLFSMGVVTYHAGSTLTLDWTDNVGIYHTNWCNIGIFVDEQLTCRGAWSGSYNNTTFSQQSLHCDSHQLGPGIHNITVKHRSQYCVYGNYLLDDGGALRQLRVKEQI